MNQDPIGLSSGQPNFFAYPGDPNSQVDPKGLNSNIGKCGNKCPNISKLNFSEIGVNAMNSIKEKNGITKALQIGLPAGSVLIMIANGVDIITPYSIGSADWISYLEASNNFSEIGKKAIQNTAEKAAYDLEIQNLGSRAEIEFFRAMSNGCMQ